MDFTPRDDRLISTVYGSLFPFLRANSDNMRAWTYVKPVDRFIPARMVETDKAISKCTDHKGCIKTYLGQRQRHSELIFRAFPINPKLVSSGTELIRSTVSWTQPEWETNNHDCDGADQVFCDAFLKLSKEGYQCATRLANVVAAVLLLQRELWRWETYDANTSGARSFAKHATFNRTGRR